MIGVFDSGFGGLTILKAFLEDLPEYDYLYLSLIHISEPTRPY